MKYIITLCLLLLSVTVTAPVFADTLDSARRSGQVGETANGYIAPIGTPSAATSILVTNVNSGRNTEYRKIAARNGQTLDVVEKLAAKKIFGNLPPGTNVQDASGGWTKK